MCMGWTVERGGLVKACLCFVHCCVMQVLVESWSWLRERLQAREEHSSGGCSPRERGWASTLQHSNKHRLTNTIAGMYCCRPIVYWIAEWPCSLASDLVACSCR